MFPGRAELHIIQFVFCIQALQIASSSNKELTAQHLLLHIAVDNETGDVFIGGENILLRATKELYLKRSVSTGPEKDHPQCLPPGIPPVCTDYKRVWTNNRNKILLIDKERGKLITCGSVFNGVCQLRDLDTLHVLDKKDDKHVASSSPSQSIAFIAPGPIGDKTVMYVGSTWFARSSLVLHRAAVSSRSLEANNLFDFVEIQFHEPFSVITIDHPENFIVRYIYGFSSGMFSYFIQVQLTLASYKSEEKRYHTTIGRVCQKDKQYASYVEMPLVCKSSGVKYNIAQSAFLTKPGKLLSSVLGSSGDALFVTFGNSSLRSPNATRYSAVCVFSIKGINQKLSENIKKCFDGPPQNEGMPWAKLAGGECKKTSVDISEPFCPGQIDGDSYPNHPIGGTIAVSANAVFLYDSASLTAIAAMPVNNSTAIFLGTQHGQLLKVSAEDGMYEYLTIAQGHAVKQLLFSADNKAVYALSYKKVTMVPLQNCKAYATCHTCVGRKDPFCGWCTLYKKCSELSECPSASLDASRFAKQTSQCIKFLSVTPDKIPVGTNTELEIVMSNLPPLPKDQDYKCHINGVEQQSHTSPGKIICGIPKNIKLPQISGSKGDILVNLELYSTETSLSFVGRKIAFYDCSLITGCRDCSEGDYTCDWCVYQGICSGNGTSECPTEVVLSKERRQPNSKGCPRLVDNQTFYIPDRRSKNIVLQAKDLPERKVGFDYNCVVNVDGKKFQVAATWDSENQLTCSPGTYLYTQNLQQMAVSLSVWQGKHEVYRPENVSVTLYKCYVGRTDCSFCLVADAHLQCGWCPLAGPCVVKEACKSSSWIPRHLPCKTLPNITRVWPMAGPESGGTEIEIHGVDLGKSFIDIKDSVTIGQYKCIPDPTKYQAARRIHCNTSASNQPYKDFVAVEVNGLTGDSPLMFLYHNPEVLDFEPKKGPLSGGSTIKVTGSKLNTGRNIDAFIGDTRCELVDRMSVTDTILMCVTTAVSVRTRRATNSSSTTGSVTLAFDGYTPPSPVAQFIFTPDPLVDSLTPKQSILSGGLKLTVIGENFDSIQEPKIFFTNPAVRYTSKAIENCERRSDRELMCRSPNASAIHVTPDSRNGSEVNVGFLMDGVQSLTNFTTMAIKRDPNLTPFKDGVKEATKSLILEGEHLGSVTKRDVFVTVGTVECNITSMAENQVVCLLPEQSVIPKVQDELYVVEVVIGNRIYKPGKMKFSKSDTSKISMYLYIGIAAGAAVLVVVILLLVCAYYKKRTQQKKNIRTFETRMNNLESKVAKECREAFAELQTDMTDLTNNMTAVGMPFLSFRQFALHVLFPGVEDHPVLHARENGRSAEKESGLRQFSQMINNKKFLLVFIHTLEAQSSFQMKDRCNVASLLIVALQGKMEYVTDILKHLLCELIRKSVAKSHPKLLLRRTESVAEKLLTNWLAVCMYHFLKTEAGEPLFMLYKAIKTQTEKGPIDVVTGEARYSLSEDRLLRQTTDYREIAVQVKFEDDDSSYAVILLDCDTITQAKSKILDTIYKGKPFSDQLDKDSLQLEWLQISGRTKPLRDDDSSSVVEGVWRKLNTLQHYQLPDGAMLRLVTRQTYFYSSTDSVHRSRKSLPRVGFSASSYTPIMAADGPEERGRVWHLLKQLDYVHERGDDSRHSKMLSEIYLTRLLATKGTLQQYVDRLFAAVFIRRGTPIPLAIKFLFDLLDEQAKELNLTDSEVLHTWKNNSLPLRFWINMIKNPNFIFDISKSGIVDSCLSVVAQLFMDSCSVSDHKLGKDSPSNKLLYAKELPAYRVRVECFYSDIQKSRGYSSKDLSDYFSDISTQYSREFNTDNALKDLYQYVVKYQDQLQDALEEDGQTKYTSKIEHVVALMTDDLV